MPNSSIPTSRSRRGAGEVTMPSLGRALLVAVLAALAVGWGLAHPAAACSCAGLSTAQQFARADVVFVGRLVERTVEEPLTSSVDPARHVFTVDGAWKGEVPERAVVLSAESGASCGLELRGNGPFVVFAGDAGTHLDAGLCDGTTELTPAVEAELDDLAGPASSAAVVPGSHPDPQDVGWWTGGRIALWGGLAALLALLPLRVLLVRRRRRP